MHGYYTMGSRKFPEGQRKKENKKIEIQTLWENSDPLGAIVEKPHNPSLDPGTSFVSVFKFQCKISKFLTRNRQHSEDLRFHWQSSGKQS